MEALTYIQEFLGRAVNHEVAQFGFAFMLAAWVHAREMKKEIATQMGSIATSIDDVAKALREDLSKQSSRLEKVEDGVNKLNTRVEKLETKEK